MTNSKKILVIDDDLELCLMLVSYLKQFNYSVDYCTNPLDSNASKQIQASKLILLDVMLPGQNGFHVCREIRKLSQVPIIFVSAQGGVNDRIVGLELGADDYIQKPFEPRELLARIEAIFRRMEVPSVSEAFKFISETLSLDTKQRTATLDNSDLVLTTLEFDLLALLMEHAGQVLCRDSIRKKLNKSSWDGLDRSIDIAVSRIRQRIGDNPKQPKLLKTVWGEGYLFAKEVKHAS